MFILRIICLFLFIFATPVSAQDSKNGTPDTPLNFVQANKELDKMNRELNTGKISAQETSNDIQYLNQLQDKLIQAKTAYASSLDNVQKKINALGAAPKEGEKEPAEIARQRKEFTATADGYKAQIAQADLIRTKIEELNSLILKIRNQTLLNNILVKQSSILHPQEFWTSLVSFSGFLFEIAKSPVSWYDGLDVTGKNLVKNNVIYVSLAMAAALAAAIYLSLYIKKWFGYKRNIERPDYSQKVRAAIWMLVARGMIPAAIIGAFLAWQKNNQIINDGSFGLLLKTVAVYLLYYYLCKAVVKVIFTPHSSRWRLIEVDDDKALSISSALIFSVAAVCIVSFFQKLAAEMEYNSDIIYSLKIFANAVKAFCVILVARRSLYDSNSLSDDELQNDDEVADLSASSKASLLITFLMAGAFALSLFGYVRLSEFIINRFIASVIILGVFYMVGKLLKVLFHQILLFKFWIRTFRINRRRLVKTEFWFGLLLTPLLGILAILTLLAVWGASVDILISNVKNFLVGFNIGGVHISITSILLGILCFLVSMFLFKMLKNSFISGSLSKIEMDDGVKSSLLSVLGFIGIIFSAILAIAVMGGSFGSIAIIAGALSFGAGLGLQSIVSNLVAGMTILFERPIKIGDWVIINGQEGIVKKINMRATELETWGKSNVIIPNSDILSSSLINMTYSNRMGRIDIQVGTGYDSDIDLVRKTLLEIAKQTPDVLSSPEPFVAFLDLADSSLNFQVSCYTANIYSKRGISDNIREQIIKRFKEKGIEIPFPQRVVYLQQESMPVIPAASHPHVSAAPL